MTAAPGKYKLVSADEHRKEPRDVWTARVITDKHAVPAGNALRLFTFDTVGSA